MIDRIDVAGAQIQGRRELQEDSFLFTRLIDAVDQRQQCWLAIIADGIGGHGGGNIASHLAVRAFHEFLITHGFDDARSPVSGSGIEDVFAKESRDVAELSEDTQPDLAESQKLLLRDGESGQGANVDSAHSSAPTAPPVRPNETSHVASTRPESLQNALAYANQKLAEAKSLTPELAAMGCTLVAVFLDCNRLWWISVGDSHLYLERDGDLQRINALHNYGAFMDEQARRGDPIELDPSASPKLLISSVEGTDIPLVDCPVEPLRLQPGDTLILATDGLDALSEGQLIYYAMSTECAAACAADLLKAVEAMGHPRQDNTTVIALKCGGADDGGVSSSEEIDLDLDL